MTKVFTQKQIQQLEEHLENKEQKYTINVGLKDLLIIAAVSAFGTEKILSQVFPENRINGSIMFGSRERIKSLLNNRNFSAFPSSELFDQLQLVVMKAEKDLENVVPDTTTVYHALLRHNELDVFNTTGVYTSLESLHRVIEKHYPGYSIFQVIETEVPAKVEVN